MTTRQDLQLSGFARRTLYFGSYIPAWTVHETIIFNLVYFIEVWCPSTCTSLPSARRYRTWPWPAFRYLLFLPPCKQTWQTSCVNPNDYFPFFLSCPFLSVSPSKDVTIKTLNENVFDAILNLCISASLYSISRSFGKQGSSPFGYEIYLDLIERLGNNRRRLNGKWKNSACHVLQHFRSWNQEHVVRMIGSCASRCLQWMALIHLRHVSSKQWLCTICLWGVCLQNS